MNQPQRSEEVLRRNRGLYIAEAGFEYFISLFVTGTFLTYILLSLGFSTAATGIITSIGTYSIIAQLATLWWRRPKVKRMMVAVCIINQFCFTCLYALPISSGIDASLKRGIFIALFVVGSILSHGSNPIRVNWLMESVSDSSRGRFTAIKEMISLLGGMAISLGFGALADHFEASGDMNAYYITSGLAILALTVLHTLTLIFTTESAHPERPPLPIKEHFHSIFTNKTLLKVIGVGTFWNMANAFSASFFAAYLQKDLAFPIFTITVMGAVGSFSRILVSPFLGKLADRTSFAFCMQLCFGIAAIAFLFAAFTAPGWTRWLYLGYLILHACAMGGINSGSINLIFDYVPHEERTAALAISNVVAGLLGITSSLIGAVLLSRIQNMGGLRILGATLHAQQVLALISVVLIVCLILYVKFVIFPLRRNAEIKRDGA